ncbi:unnamed protein product [Brachionus calyciflorus]|uniref:Uncharacterized protein n=1 Tax=Brachionus calyciflorus TaxID=104777 RepID=A0A813MQZ3_9BILA|nr:unnamed protein product [Brachionus calyciflorus]
MMENFQERLIILLLICLCVYCSKATDSNLSGQIDLDSVFIGKKEPLFRRQVYKRIQLPFKWGKRASSGYDEFCSEFFGVLIARNKNELRRLSQIDMRRVYDECFKYMLKLTLLSQQETFEESTKSILKNEKEFQDDQADNEISYIDNAKATILKRTNIPFRWG